MRSPHLLQFLPDGLLGIKLQRLTWVNLLPIEPTLGIAAKNGVLIVEFANQLRDRGEEFGEAIIKAAAIRLRPVLMTSLCTAFGAVPFLLATGAGAEQRLPVGIVVISCTMISVFLTLLVVPAVYSLVARNTKPSSYMSHLVDRLLGARDQNSGLGRA